MTDQATPAQLREVMPFAQLIGIELLQASPELVRGTLAWAPERCTAGGLMHGGALMALADTCGGACAFLNLPHGASGTATIESKTNFMRGVRAGTTWGHLEAGRQSEAGMAHSAHIATANA